MTGRTSNILTQKFVERVLRGIADNGRHKDGGNLYCLVRGKAASWIFLTTKFGKQEVHTIGSVKKLADLSGSNDIAKRAQTSLKTARDKAAEYRANIAKGMQIKAIPTSDYPTLEQVVQYYCERKKLDRKSLNPYLAYFEPIYKDMGPIFKKEMGIAYRNKLIDDKKAENTIGSYLHVMKAAFTTYQKDHSIEFVHPLAGVSYIKKLEDVNDREPLPHHIIKYVYDNLKDDEFRRLWLQLIVTGARLNEIYGLKSKDFTSDGFIRIEANERRRIKNAASKRIIPNFIKVPKRSREYYWDDMKSVSNISQRFQRLINHKIDKADQGNRKFTTHSLRHSLTDFMRIKGVQQNIEDMYLGHAAKDTSNRVYGSTEGRKTAMKEHLEPIIKEYLATIGIKQHPH